VQAGAALEEIANSGSSFPVAVRVDAVGRVRALNDIPVPRRYPDLFSEIPEHRILVPGTVARGSARHASRVFSSQICSNFFMPSE
jgi:hypothetical protein